MAKESKSGKKNVAKRRGPVASAAEVRKSGRAGAAVAPSSPSKFKSTQSAKGKNVPRARRSGLSKLSEAEVSKPVNLGRKVKAVAAGGKLKSAESLRIDLASDEEEDLSVSEDELPIVSRAQSRVQSKTASPYKARVTTTAPKPKLPPKKVASLTDARRRPGRPRGAPSALPGQNMAEFAEDFLAQSNVPGANAVIIECKDYNPKTEHRKRVRWTLQEENALRNAVREHGVGNWATIMNDPKYRFHSHRTQVDLKDKYRNMDSYVPYSHHPIRRFMLVDANHHPILSSSGTAHVYNNRWPRDAAMKVATRSQFYPETPLPGQQQQSILIFLKEIVSELTADMAKVAADGRVLHRDRSKIVHVYKGTRTMQAPPVDIPKFQGIRKIWVPTVEKVREEILVIRKNN